MRAVAMPFVKENSLMDFAAARHMMVDSQVRPNDVTDLRLLDALETIPRESFLPAGLKEQAYVERELPYAPGRSLIAARDFAKLVTALSPEPTDLALDVACGVGYSTAVLSMLCEMAVAVEADEALAAQAQENWAALDRVNTAALIADPAKGAADQGPYDVILIASVIEQAPDVLLQQLKDGGRLAAIIRDGGVAKGVVFTKSGDDWSSKTVFDAAARQVLAGFEKPRTFQF